VRLPPQATDDDLRAALANGRLLCALLRRLLPGALLDDAASDNLGRFRAAVERMGVPTFSAYDLERVIELPPPSSSMPRHSICLFPYRLTRPCRRFIDPTVRPGGAVGRRYLRSCFEGPVRVAPRRRPPRLFLPHQV